MVSLGRPLLLRDDARALAGLRLGQHALPAPGRHLLAALLAEVAARPPAPYDAAIPNVEAPMRRVLPMLLAFACLAFAPAPLPKPERGVRPAPVSMEGLWRRQSSGGAVRITATAWTNNPENGGPPTFTLRI